MNKEVRERIDEFLRGKNRGEAFTIKEISLAVGSSQEEVEEIIEEVIRREWMCQGGGSIIEGKEQDCYCCRAKHLDEPPIEPDEISSIRRFIHQTF